MRGAEGIRKHDDRRVLGSIPLTKKLCVLQFEKSHGNVPLCSAGGCCAVYFRQNTTDEFLRAAQVVADVKESFEVGGRQVAVQAAILTQTIFQVAIFCASFLASCFDQHVRGHFSE